MLLGAFCVGFLLTIFASRNDVFQQLLSQTLPPEALAQMQAHPIWLGLAGGLGISGLINVFLIGNLLSSYYNGFMFVFMLVVIMVPDMAIMAGIVTMPFFLIACLYGWISLSAKIRKELKAAGITGDNEIVELYQQKHPLNPAYEAMALETRKTVNKINLAYGLGLVAIFCVLFFLDNLFLDMVLIALCLWAFQYLARLRSHCFAAISSLLLDQCDPEACASALIYFGRKGKKYKLSNRALFAQCLIYLNEPELAQDVLIEFPKSTPNNLMAYWSLRGYIDYLLKDEDGLVHCQQEMQKIRPNMGPMGLMIKTNELAALENKINLMHGEFNTCKKYYLNLLRQSPTNLQKADCDYYIALISFVQEDYELAKMYFEKTLQVGNRLYFVRNARNYLDKIEHTADPNQTIYALNQGDDPVE